MACPAPLRSGTDSCQLAISGKPARSDRAVDLFPMTSLPALTGLGSHNARTRFSMPLISMAGAKRGRKIVTEKDRGHDQRSCPRRINICSRVHLWRAGCTVEDILRHMACNLRWSLLPARANAEDKDSVRCDFFNYCLGFASGPLKVRIVSCVSLIILLYASLKQ